MMRSKMNKERLSVLIDAELLKEFKEAVLAEHGKLYGVLGNAVEEALREWLKKKGLV